ncbi:MAG: hypothetical protein P4L36_19075 [Holophaga sp.]|nr:hypothetical protein [Holophaga sp.]
MGSNVKRLQRSLVAGICLAGLVGCTSRQPPLPVKQVNSASSPALFAGSSTNGGSTVPCVWSSTSRTDLPVPAGNYGIAVSPALSVGGTIYAAGMYRDSNNKPIPCYWAGATCTPLTDGNVQGLGVAVAVSGNTVYTAGMVEIDNNYHPCYWSGTTLVDLVGDLTEGGMVSGIAIAADGTVRSAGFYQSSGGYEIACTWNGTQRTDLPSGNQDSEAYAMAFAMALSGNTVYTAGTATPTMPCYWTGTAGPTFLPVPTGATGYATAIAVSGGTVYLGGYYNNGSFKIPCVWTVTGAQSTRTDLAGDGVHSAEVRALSVSGTTVSAAGIYSLDGTHPIPCVWTGTTRTDLSVVATYGNVWSAMELLGS